ncbi:hypothetical protein ACQR3P_26455 [Rhodococcus sp. IEGM1300]
MTKLAISDSTIEKITYSRDSVCVEILDWREELWSITFNNVSGCKSISAVGTELSDMYVEDVTALSKEVASFDASEVGASYCFTCAREGWVVLTIVASGYAIKKIL